MGLSFDLTVEELPDRILDRTWLAHQDPITGRGWHNSNLPNSTWNIFLEGRWRDIIPTEGSWIVNDLQVANNVVIACGSYEAIFFPDNPDGPAGLYDPNTINPNMVGRPFRDGFIATCKYDLLDNPLAWQIVPMRTMLETPNLDMPLNADVTDAGLQSFCVDFRTNVLANGSETSPVIITAVGHVPVKGIQNSVTGTSDYAPFKKSVYNQQDYLPTIYTFEIQVSANDPLETLETPAYLFDGGDPNNAIPADSFYFGSVDFLTGPDRLGHAFHLFGVDQPWQNDVDRYSAYSQAAFMQAGVRILPLEQITYRCHQIGLDIVSPTGSYFYKNPDPYRSYRFLPTPSLSTFPVMKPVEFFFCTPDYNFTHYYPTFEAANTRINEFAAHGEFRRGSNMLLEQQGNEAMSDWAIWRQGFIPRRLWNVESVYNSSFRAENSLWYRTYDEGESNPATIAYLVFTGDCLEDDPTNRSSGDAKLNGADPVYSPLVAVSNIGVLGTSSEGVPGEPGAPYSPAQGYAWTYTRRNMFIEDSGALTDTSLDNATIVATLPVIRANYPGQNDQGYTITFLMNSTEPEPRGQILMAQPWLFNLEFTAYARDWRPIVPVGFWGGDFETETGIELPDYWTRTVGQPFGLTVQQVNLVQNLFDSYLAPSDYTTGDPTGTSIGGLGYVSRTRSGPYMLFFEGGSPSATLDYTINNFGQEKVAQYGATWKVGLASTLNSPDEQNAYYGTTVETNPQVNQVISHILNTDTTKFDGTSNPIYQWDQGLGFNINGINLVGIYLGATLPQPAGFYDTIDSLVRDLNVALAYVKSAGAPFDQNTPTGLGGLEFYKTSDGMGIYCRVDNAILAANNGDDPTSWDTFYIENSLLFSDNDNYPYNAAVPQIAYRPLRGATWDGAVLGGAAAVVGETTVENLNVMISENGKLFNDAILSGAETTRIAFDGSYDVDRAQWLFTFGSSTGFRAVASVADFSELLDQTESFYKNSPSYPYTESAMFANRQGSDSFDGVLWAGPWDTQSTIDTRLTTNVSANSESRAWKITGTTGRSVKVFLNYLLYDGLDSIIAREVMNLGLRVTPENVEWYKRKIMGQDTSSITLEELEEWMATQRQQYQDLIKSRDRHGRLRKRREEAGTLNPAVTRDLQDRLDGDFYSLDEETIEKLLPELDQLPPNPDSEESDADQLGNTLSGDIKKVDEKRRDSEN
jgi:hypothetical protein